METRSRSGALPTLLFFFLIVMSVGGCGSKDGGSPGLPPIVVISVDTLRADRLPIYGFQGVETPALTALREDSILFERAYTSVPLTLPAHLSLFTGQHPYIHGVRDNVGYRFEGGALPTLPEWLRERGYVAGGAISAYVLRGDTGLGPLFDDYDDAIASAHGSRSLGESQRSGDVAREAAERWISSHREEPFFYFLHLFEPHTPYTPPEPFRSRYGDSYEGEIAAADAIVGRFLDFLRREGIYDRALILFLSDHGEGLGDHGEREHGIFLYPETIQIPLLLKRPGKESAGERVAAPVQLLDIFPTVTALVGDTPPDLPGLDLLRLAAEGEPPTRRLYSESFYARLHLGWSELRSLVDDRHLYIEAPMPELYDLQEDPSARKNILEQERRIFRSMEAEMELHDGELAEPSAVDEEEAARLAALGYLTAPAPSNGPLRPDPKEALPDLLQLEQAYALSAGGRCGEAIPLFQGLLERNSAMFDARVELASCLRQMGEAGTALEEYRQALESNPSAKGSLLLRIADLLLELGRLEEAEAHVSALQGDRQEEGLEILARVALERGELNEAMALARQAEAAESTTKGTATLVLTRALLADGQIPEAWEELQGLAMARRSRELEPLPWEDFLRGDALARLGRSGEAEGAFRAEIARFPRHSQAYANLAVLLASQRRFGEIEPTLQAMVRAHPVGETFTLAAETALRLGDEAGAARWRSLSP